MLKIFFKGVLTILLVLGSVTSTCTYAVSNTAQSAFFTSETDINVLIDKAEERLVSAGATQVEAGISIESFRYGVSDEDFKIFLLDLIYGTSEKIAKRSARGFLGSKAKASASARCGPTYYNASSAHFCVKCAGSDTDIELDFNISKFYGWGISHHYSARNWRGSLIIAWHGSLIGRNVVHNNTQQLGVIVGGRWNSTLGWSLANIRDSIRVSNIVLCPR